MIDVRLPDGRTVSIDTDDPAAASAAARKYLANESAPQTSRDDKPSLGDYASDMAKSAGIGAAKGTIGLAGVIGDLQSAGPSFGKWIDAKLGFTTPKLTPEQEKFIAQYRHLGAGRLPTSDEIRKQVESVTGDFYQPKTTPGKYAETVGEFIPAAAIGPGGMGARIASAVTGGLASEAAGQMTQGTSAEPWARLAGGVAGAMAPSMISRAITPVGISPERQKFVDTLRASGINPTAGQATGSEALKYAESSLGNAPGAGGRTAAMEAKNLDALTAAVLSRAGETANRASPDVINAMTARIGQQFEGLSARNTLIADQRMASDLIDTAQKYVNATLPNMRASGKQNIEGIILGVVDDMRQSGGSMSGELYQATRSKLGTMAEAARGSDPTLSRAIKGIQSSLDDAMERSIAVSNPSDLGAWKATREQYKNMLVIKDAVGGAGGNAAEGLISPLQLRAAVARQNKDAYVKGRGELAELARSAAAIMQPLPQSGTAPRAFAMAVPSALGAGAGALFGGGAGGASLGALAGSAIGAAAPGMTGRVLMSAPMQAYLQNQLLTPSPVSEAARRAMLMGAMVPALQAR